MLTGLALALAMVGTVMTLQLASFITTPAKPAPVPETLPARDIPLLTPEQREEARRSGVGAFEYDSVWYVDRALPEEYWKEC